MSRHNLTFTRNILFVLSETSLTKKTSSRPESAVYSAMLVITIYACNLWGKENCLTMPQPHKFTWLVEPVANLNIVAWYRKYTELASNLNTPDASCGMHYSCIDSRNIQFTQD